ncbi:hypothetical protein BCR37DRAFT_399902 [Protomyces lactucae-debilis]|uniref:RNB domain-containing protein n=1 Tax=Protomyces lactucae-debilis TaxID=2754530 RepID=A0A1Y2F773_PROLT|nr:uncharacterized protein BCR37DRAFT_399902 [Protomyces lactucae-debilis]ORY79507.1 hypothetical protein BCR37DRAFT_399902 [Protomyces lactucae-debilis]
MHMDDLLNAAVAPMERGQQDQEYIDGEEVSETLDDAEQDATFDEPIERLSSQQDVNVGDIVEYWPDSGKKYTAVVIRLPRAEAGQVNVRHVTIDSRGCINYTESRRYLMVVPGYVDSSHFSWITDETYFLQGDPRLNVIAKKAHEFILQSEALRTDYAVRLNGLYDLLPSIVRSQAMPVSCAQAARIAFETDDITPVHIHAVHACMMRDRIHFLPDIIRSISVPIFRTRDPRQVACITLTISATRIRGPVYRHFIAQAKAIAAWGEQVTKADGPLTAVEAPAELAWDSLSWSYLWFLLQATLERPDIAEVEIYTTAAAIIVKDIGLFPDEPATRAVIHKTLKKLGILAPWDISMNRSPSLALPGHGASATADKHQAHQDQIFSEGHSDKVLLAKLRMYDMLADYRHDFGEMPVYTIDSETAHELDDGISIDNDGWMHVHIANPAAYFSPDNGIACVARERAATRYLDYDTYPMLPPALTMRFFSLAKRKRGTPCMTTSFKLKDTGEIDEILVRPSIIRNVIRTSYRAVDKVLGSQPSIYGEMKVMSSHWRDEDSPQSPTSGVPQSELTDEDVERLKAMSNYLQPSLRYRISQGAIEFPDNGQQLRRLETQPAVLPGLEASIKRPTFYSGKPGIRYMFARRDINHPVGMSKATRLVTEAAILANHATAVFCNRNNIPVMYRAAEFAMLPEEREHILSLRDENGVLKLLDLLEYQNLFRPTQNSLQPRRMDYVGLPAYMTITSPLRRYVDLCGQWALLNFFTATDFKKPMKSPRYPKPPFELDLKDILPDLERTMLAIKRRSVLSGQNVMTHLLEQKWLDGELAGAFHAYVLKPPRTSEQLSYSASVPAWGNRKVLVTRKATEPRLMAGDSIKVEVEGFDHFDFNVHCKRVA